MSKYLIQQLKYRRLPDWLRAKLVLWLFVVIPINLTLGQSLDKQSNETIIPTTERKFDREQWASLKEGVTFLDEKARQRNNETEKKGTSKRSQLFSVLIKIAIIVLAIVIFALLINQFLGDMIFTPRNKKIDRKRAIEFNDLESIESNLDEANLDDFILEALNTQDYRLAVRLYYLKILQSLKRKEIIEWKKDKTNKDYLKELKNTTFHNTPFRRLS